MKLFKGRTTPVVLAALVLVGGANVAAYAANGTPLLLGKKNVETKTALVINRGAGPALKLKTKPSAPPLAVSSSQKVTNLNADILDGFDSKALRSNIYRLVDSDTTTVRPNVVSWSLAGVPAGRYLVSWDVNLVPVAHEQGIVCAVTTNDFSRQFAADRDSQVGGWVAIWLSGSGVVDFNPATMKFFCQTLAPNLRLKQPLTLAFQKVDNTTSVSLPVLPRVVQRGVGR